LDDILSTVARLIREVIGEDWDLDEEITAKTSFAEDLELESIEFVSLAELLQVEYGGRVDFVPWLSNKELDEIIQLTVGDVVAYIESCLDDNKSMEGEAR
jgi:acyl carrier protein